MKKLKHDMQTCVTIVLGNAELLHDLDEMPSHADISEIAKDIVAAAKKLHQHIKEMK